MIDRRPLEELTASVSIPARFTVTEGEKTESLVEIVRTPVYVVTDCRGTR